MTADTPYYRTWAAGPQCQYPTCPSPPSPPTPPSTTTVTIQPGNPSTSPSLPVTGADVILLAIIGVLIVCLGVALLAGRFIRAGRGPVLRP